MIHFKAGVSLENVKPQTAVGMKLAEQVYMESGIEVMVVTSVNDGRHMTGSKHYTGEAFDTRIWGISTERLQMMLVRLNTLMDHLGFDIVLESDHFHIEYDPK